ncbi:hypothetical protein CROQUDRAFT_636311 [Cronartium quercuum f. sp. fusiforme G11]|uniref:Transmembrane protein n=1 Tax=Cronartium quercuum f. sp. fusiforme G11 TaxID=708437 RepID=A0A9P6NEU4_9BASI|nr:hypothetical protein CROQUDRAFT_636311 [Cronartium quercuum f. sp. fusiforme G11]
MMSWNRLNPFSEPRTRPISHSTNSTIDNLTTNSDPHLSSKLVPPNYHHQQQPPPGLEVELQGVSSQSLLITASLFCFFCFFLLYSRVTPTFLDCSSLVRIKLHHHQRLRNPQ